MELTSKNLYDYLSKHNANQRKIERLVEQFNCDEDSLMYFLNGGQSMGIFIYDEEDGWKTQDFAKIDSKKFFDFLYAGSYTPPKKDDKKPATPEVAEATEKDEPVKESSASTKAESTSETSAEAKPLNKSAKNELPKSTSTHKNPIRIFSKHTLKPGIDKITSETKTAAPTEVTAETSVEAPKEEPKKDEPIVQKDFLLRGLYKLILRNNAEGIYEKVMMQHYKIDEVDLRFVLDYLEFKGIFHRDSQSRWFANEDRSKDPMLAKTLIGLRNSAILNNEFKKKAMRGGR